MSRSLLLLLLFASALSAAGQQLPDAPKPRVASKTFWVSTAFAGAAAVMDAETTAHVLRNPKCHEYNPLLGPHPRRAETYAIGAATHALLAWWAYRLKKRGSRNWYVPQLLFSFGHGGASLWNAAASGC